MKSKLKLLAGSYLLVSSCLSDSWAIDSYRDSKFYLIEKSLPSIDWLKPLFRTGDVFYDEPLITFKFLGFFVGFLSSPPSVSLGTFDLDACDSIEVYDSFWSTFESG